MVPSHLSCLAWHLLLGLTEWLFHWHDQLVGVSMDFRSWEKWELESTLTSNGGGEFVEYRMSPFRLS